VEIMAWIKGTASTYRQALEILHDFATKNTKAGTPVAGSNTGTGIVTGQSSTASASVETITLTCTTGGSAAEFSVVGSVSGTQDPATINTLYCEGPIAFIIQGGGTNFVSGDSFTIGITSMTPKWEAERYVHTPGAEYELILKGYGYSTADEIFVGMQTYESGTNYGWRVNGFTGFNSGSAFLYQPGAVSGSTIPWDQHFVPTIDVSLTYWFFVSPQRIMGTFLSGSVYTHFYTGWLDSLATPSQWTYPMAVGSNNFYQEPYTATTGSHAAYWNPQDIYTSMSILDNTSWQPERQGAGSGDKAECYPSTLYDIVDMQASIDGSILQIPAYPIVQSTISSVYGTWEGVTIPSHLTGTISTEDVLISSSGASVVFQDTHRALNLCAIELKGDI
jgi:hypothetical protein